MLRKLQGQLISKLHLKRIGLEDFVVKETVTGSCPVARFGVNLGAVLLEFVDW
jgi:hypothetical protein